MSRNSSLVAVAACASALLLMTPTADALKYAAIEHHLQVDPSIPSWKPGPVESVPEEEVSLVGADVIELELREGRKRQVRRMCEAVGHPVVALTRVRFGPLELGELAVGAHRLLSDAEVAGLREAARR